MDIRDKSAQLIKDNQKKFRQLIKANIVSCPDPHLITNPKLTKRFEDIYKTPNELANNFLKKEDIHIMKRDKINFKNINHNFRSMNILKPQKLAEVIAEQEEIYLNKKKKEKAKIKQINFREKSESMRNKNNLPKVSPKMSFHFKHTHTAKLEDQIKNEVDKLDDDEVSSDNQIEKMKNQINRIGNLSQEKNPKNSVLSLTKKNQIMAKIKEMLTAKYGSYEEKVKKQALKYLLAEQNK